MPELYRGLYEVLITRLIETQLTRLAEDSHADRSELRAAEAADRVALHVARAVEAAVEAVPEAQRSEFGGRIARDLTELIAQASGRDEVRGLQLAEPTSVLRSILRRMPGGAVESIDAPLIPLLDTTILTNAPGEPRVGHQIQREIGSADRIDLVMAFIRRSGLAPLKDALRRHIDAGRPVRVLTTVFTGSTEAAALEDLIKLGAEVRVSYDETGTRLHAKAWLFHRDSGYSTAYVGSSNLTRAAQVTGLEWNVRLSAARNRSAVEKIGAVFESYWQQPEFEGYDAARFEKAVERPDGSEGLSPLEVRLEPFQERLLEQVELSRQMGYHRNLLVSATGTGKTVMAAVDYAGLRASGRRARLLFVAHREEILKQSRSTFRQVLRDGSFGELWVGGARPQHFEYVFASIQSLAGASLESLDPQWFDIVIVDEFHHAAAATYQALLHRIQPVELLGLTATPERADGLPILQWFGDRIAAELRLWDAIDQHRLVPFSYFGIADDLDLSEIPWRRSIGYDVGRLTEVITATEVWARHVAKQFLDLLGEPATVRALGFCVSVAHAQYMARVFTSHGIPSVAVSAESSPSERQGALRDLAAGTIAVVFSVDLFNEGVDVPSVNALLMLRPTESPLLFLQQLGRGLRKASGKSICTVLDFVGQHRREFRYDRRLRALLGGSRSYVERQVQAGFPYLPAGCSMQLDRVSAERVLASIRNAIPGTWPAKVEELRTLGAGRPQLSLGEFLVESGLDLQDVYGNNHSWSDLRQAAGLSVLESGPHERDVRRAMGRLLHVDDPDRLTRWQEWVREPSAPEVERLTGRDKRLLRMLLVQALGARARDYSLASGTATLWSHPQALRELAELFEVLKERPEHVPIPFTILPDVPFVVHAQYTRLEILAAMQEGNQVYGGEWREGVRYFEALRTDAFVLTLDKTQGQFSPTTRYRDYAISRELVHWESQSTTSEDSPTGRRYRNHVVGGSTVLLFARLNTDERGFVFLGPATYVHHAGERPMAITWRLTHRLPGDLFERFAAAVA